MIPLNTALIRELSLLPDRPKIMVIGETDTGKSTVVKALAHWFQEQSQNVTVVDSDIGQSDIGPPGFVSCGILTWDTTFPHLITNGGSYLVGKTSPYGRELSVVTGTKICVEAAQRSKTDAILIDTCGLVKPARGVQIKCAKAEMVKPDLILALNTPELTPLVNCLNSLGFRVRNFLPSRKAQTKPAEIRKENRISRWNAYIGNNPSLLGIHHSHIVIRQWWDESRYVDIDQIPHGTVAAIQDPRTPEFQIPCVWTVSEDNPFVLAPLPGDYKLGTIWITAYQLELNGTTVISA
ncbi:MAG TPA: Clp1/GlmU family protein [Clostridia bacterium]|nr:Clp1/GlmU family protein [Clostridia bacterium]